MIRSKKHIFLVFLTILVSIHLVLFIIYGRDLLKSDSYAEIELRRSNLHADLFNDSLEYAINPTITSFSDRREPISYFDCQGGDYSVVVMEFSTRNSSPLTVQLTSMPGEIAAYTPYEGMNILHIDSQITQDTIIKKDSIFLYLKGDSLNEERVGDSLVIYSLVLNNMTLAHEAGGPLILSARPKLLSPAKKHPSEFALYRRDGRDYVILLFPRKQGIKDRVRLAKLLK